MVIVITQLHTTFMVLLAIVPFFMIPVFADVEVEGVSGFYGHDDAYQNWRRYHILIITCAML